jgi:hypothetical protein
MSPTREPRIAHEPAAVHLTGTATGHVDLALTADGEDILRVDDFEAYQYAPLVRRRDGTLLETIPAQYQLESGTIQNIGASMTSELEKDRLNQTEFAVVPGERGDFGPDYTYYTAKYETTSR